METPEKKDKKGLNKLKKLIEHTIFNEERYKTVKNCISDSVKGEKAQKLLKETFFKYLFNVYTELHSLITFDYDRFKKEFKTVHSSSQKDELLKVELEERDAFLHQILTRLEGLASNED